MRSIMKGKAKYQPNKKHNHKGLFILIKSIESVTSTRICNIHHSEHGQHHKGERKGLEEGGPAQQEVSPTNLHQGTSKYLMKVHC